MVLNIILNCRFKIMTFSYLNNIIHHCHSHSFRPTPPEPNGLECTRLCPIPWRRLFTKFYSLPSFNNSRVSPSYNTISALIQQKIPFFSRHISLLRYFYICFSVSIIFFGCTLFWVFLADSNVVTSRKVLDNFLLWLCWIFILRSFWFMSISSFKPTRFRDGE